MPNIGLVYALSAGANSILILDQSASSSSASNIGKAVATPWPISERSTITSTLSSAPMRSHAFGASGAAGAGPKRDPDGSWKPMTSRSEERRVGKECRSRGSAEGKEQKREGETEDVRKRA